MHEGAFPGSNGHIAMRTPDLTAAVAELKEKGFSFNMDTAAYFDDGRLKNVYLDGEYGGFAIHIMGKMSVLSRRRALQPWASNERSPSDPIPEAKAGGRCLRLLPLCPGCARIVQGTMDRQEYQSHSKRPPPCQLDPGKGGAFSFTPLSGRGAPRRTESRPYK